MILEKTPVTMAQASEIVRKLEEKRELKNYMKKFTKLSSKKAEEMTKKLQDLNNLKVKVEHMVKVVDMVPKEKEELNKIFTDVTLSEEENNAILEITQRY